MICSLVVIASSGCAMRETTTDQYETVRTVHAWEEVDLDSIQTIAPGQTIRITTKEQLLVKNIKVFFVGMVVTDVNAERIQGDFVPIFGEPEKGMSGTAVEINVENIERILISTEKQETFQNQMSRPCYDIRNPLYWNRLPFDQWCN